ncbi:MAG: DUF4919 domain-containing protein [Gammaproteobacteria bacterium]|nr:DUF4919 domain-containing protein [Gammaproteobacteria bacterium]
MSYTDTSAYKLYSDSEPKLVNPVLGALSINDCDRGLASASDLLDLNFVSLTGHYAAMVCNLKLNMEETSRYHQYILKGLMESIGNSGDGRSPESAYIVISASELKTFIQLIGLKIESQSLLSQNDKTFEVMRVSHPDTGDEFDMLFDVSIPAAKSFKYFE